MLCSRTSTIRRTGFSLVEVLLGIIILAIGLLGLASVFPLVVRQQREAQDTVMGVSASAAAEAFLTQHRGYLDSTIFPPDMIGLNAPSGKSGWGALSWALYQTAIEKKTEDFGLVRWSTVFNDAGKSYKTAYLGPEAETNAGGIKGAMYLQRYDNGAVVPNKGVLITPFDRLFPLPTGSVSPLFIWDVVPMLATPADVDNPIATQTSFPLRLAVFVRRIDPGIRVPAGLTLADAIRQQKVLPLAVDATGMPTLNGNGSYPQFFYPSVRKAYRRFGAQSGPFNVIEFNQGTGLKSFDLARQVGQQLLDNEGNIYTVLALPDEADSTVPYKDVLDRCVVISPGIPVGYLNSVTSKSENQSDIRTQRTLELLYSPQIPAQISTFIVRP